MGPFTSLQTIRNLTASFPDSMMVLVLDDQGRPRTVAGLGLAKTPEGTALIVQLDEPPGLEEEASVTRPPDATS